MSFWTRIFPEWGVFKGWVLRYLWDEAEYRLYRNAVGPCPRKHETCACLDATKLRRKALGL